MEFEALEPILVSMTLYDLLLIDQHVLARLALRTTRHLTRMFIYLGSSVIDNNSIDIAVLLATTFF
jgi:hypothetical protein